MGDNFLKQQTENFRKGRDLAFEQISQPALFARPDVISTVYTAVPVGIGQFTAGEHLSVIASEDGTQAMLARGHEGIGRIDGDAAKALLNALSEKGSGGIAAMKITEVSSLSGFGKATLIAE